MTEPVPLTDTHDSGDSDFAMLVAEITERLHDGQDVDINDYLNRHPRHRNRLLQLFPAVSALVDLGVATNTDHRMAIQTPGQDGSTVGVLGDFRILREVGRGGMGIVYEALQISLGRRVALKVFPFAGALRPRELRRFQTEAQAAASLDHPHIVQVHFVGCERGVHYFAMQFVEGQTLEGLIRGTAETLDSRSEPIANRENLSGAEPDVKAMQSSEFDDQLDEHARDQPVPTGASGETDETHSLCQALQTTVRIGAVEERFRVIAQLGIQAALALEHAHRMGVVHRDIKPANLMVDAEGQLWITDFGLATTRSESGLTMSRDVVGTLRYMSPEQLQAEHGLADHRADVYSLGATLYELATLRPAFTEKDQHRLMRRVLEDEPRRPRERNTAIPLDLETIILKAMAKEARARYATAGALADDLQRFVEHKPIAARRPSLLDRSRKWARRHRAAVRFAVVLLLLVVTGAGWLFSQRWQQRVDVERVVSGHIEAARAVMVLDYQAAERHVAKAQARLNASNHPHGSLKISVAAVTHDVQARKQAEQHYDRFRQLRYMVHAHLYNGTPYTMGQVQEHGRSALDLYQVFDRDRLEGQAVFDRLGNSERADLREAIAELLFIWGRLEINKVQHAEALPDGHRRAIEAWNRIANVGRDVSPVHLWIGVSYDFLGNGESSETASRRGDLEPATALGYFIRGEYRFFHRRDALAALEDYQRALHVRTNHYVSLLASGLTLAELRRWDVAQAMFTGSLSANPGSIISRLARADTYIEQKKFDLADLDLAEAERLSPGNYSVYGVRAWFHAAQNDREQQLFALDQAVRLCRPPEPSVFYLRGMCLREIGDHEKAIEDFSQTLHLATSRFDLTGQTHRGALSYLPEDWIVCAYVDRGLSYQTVGRYADAVADLRKGVTFEPSTGQGQETRGIGYFALGDFENAVASFRRAIQDAHEEDLEYTWLAASLAHLGEWEEALANYNKQAELRDPWPQFLFLRGRAHFGNGDFEAAIADFNRAIEIKPETARLYLARGIVLWELGDAEQALLDVERTIQLRPDLGAAYCHRAFLLAELGDWEAVPADIEKAFAINAGFDYGARYASWGRANNMARVGWLLTSSRDSRLHRPQLVLKVAREAVEVRPDSCAAWALLGAAQYRGGDYRAALSALEKAVAIKHRKRDVAAMFLAMTHHRLGNQQDAQYWFNQASRWIDARPYAALHVRQLFAEAANVLGIVPSDDQLEERQSIDR